MDLEAEIDALYAAPFEEFIARRNELAARLKKEDREASQRVKALAKPPLVAWVVNQLHRRHGRTMEELIASGERLRRVQAEILEGGGPGAMREAMRDRRALVDALAREAADVLAGSGHPATDSTMRRIERTLEALAIAGWGDGPPGRLDRELEPPGMDVLGGLLVGAPSAAPRERAQSEGPPVQKEHRDDEAREAREREAEAREARAALEAAEAEHAARVRDVQALRVALEEARRRADVLEREAGDLERRARAARAEASEAARAREAARAAFEAAGERVASASRELERAREALRRASVRTRDD